MGIFSNNLLAGAGGQSGAVADFYDYQIEQSARFENESDTYLGRTNSFSAVSTFTFSTWLKRGAIDENYKFFMMFKSNQGLGFADTNAITILNGSSHALGSALFRDTGGWMHIVLKSSSGTGVLYVNGTQFHSNTGMSFHGGSGSGAIRVGNYGGSGNGFSGYLAETVMIDGTAYDPTTFAETKNGVWVPKDFSSSVTFGSQGFYLKYENASDLGNDSSGNNNDYTPNNMGPDHQVLDSPTFGS
jgi:hypothetical protein